MTIMEIIISLSFCIDVPNVTEQPQNKTVVLPGTAVFNCTAKAYPGPTIQWLRVVNGLQTLITPSSKYSIVSSAVPYNCICQLQASTLTVTSTTPDDAAQYICRATNTEGSIDNTASLSVQGKFAAT